MTYSASGTIGPDFNADRAGSATAGNPGAHAARGGFCSASSGRKRWAPLELGAMIGGFVVFWPLGLLALGLKLCKGEMWRGASDGSMPWSGAFDKRPSMPGSNPFKGFGLGGFTGFATGPSSGNAAFDAYKREQLARLDEERRKLEDEQRAFAEYMRRLAEAKDKQEFDRFMAERAETAKPVNSTDM